MQMKKVVLIERYMKKTWITTACLLFATVAIGQVPELSPTPQSCVLGKDKYQKPSIFLFKGLNETDTVNQRFAENLLPKQKEQGKYWKLIVGEAGDRSVRSVRKRVPQQSEGYYLRVRDHEIIVAGRDERGTFYGLQTLKQLLQQPSIPELEITDYPDVPFRGIVEGYYGKPMDFETHLRMFGYYGANKMNIYLYGPKDDPYHSSPHWRQPYPEKEAQEIREMARVARNNGLDFVWAIHPGKDIRWNQADRDSVILKFESMYQLGVRAFAVFFDDISGEGAKADKQVELLNYINEHFIHQKPDVKPLIMCPTEYNREWTDPKNQYLETLGSKLNPDIAIMWTGNSVICNIQQEDMDWINERIKRKAFIWWNYPVNDYVMDHLLLGSVYGNSLHIADKMSGFVSNPMEHAEASKVAVFGIADYCWNMEAFDDEKSWNLVLKELMPTDADAFKLFAEHNADPGTNVHHFERDESVRIKPVLDEFLQQVLQHTATFKEDEVRTEFENIVYAADLLMANEDNPYLTAEIDPWFHQFKTLGEMGIEVMNLYKAWQEQYQEAFLKSYRHLRALQHAWYKYDMTMNQEVQQPGIKTGSKVLKPFIDKLFTHLTDEYNHRFQAELPTTLNYSAYKLESNVEQLKNLPVFLRNKTKITVSPLNEVLKWQDGGQLTLALGGTVSATELRLDLGDKQLDWIKVEIQQADGNWTEVQLANLWESVYRVKLEGKEMTAFRLTNRAGQSKECRLKTLYLQQAAAKTADKK